MFWITKALSARYFQLVFVSGIAAFGTGTNVRDAFWCRMTVAGRIRRRRQLETAQWQESHFLAT